MNWYKTSQQLLRGDPQPLDFDKYDPGYGVRELGKQLGSSAAEGPGMYFTTDEKNASWYGSNITRKTLQNANILTKESPKFKANQINKLLQGISKEKMENAASNWDENYYIGKKKLIESIMTADNPVDQLMIIWADVFYHQNPSEYINLMLANKIDGISMDKHSLIANSDVTHYVIYNKNVLK
jgi:hypothetical protein